MFVMAIKDWKKEYVDEATTHYKKKKSVERIYIYNKGYFRGHEKMYVVSTNIYGNRKNRTFKTKQQAQAYARQYMRTH